MSRTIIPTVNDINSLVNRLDAIPRLLEDRVMLESVIINEEWPTEEQLLNYVNLMLEELKLFRTVSFSFRAVRNTSGKLEVSVSQSNQKKERLDSFAKLPASFITKNYIQLLDYVETFDFLEEDVLLTEILQKISTSMDEIYESLEVDESLRGPLSTFEFKVATLNRRLADFDCFGSQWSILKSRPKDRTHVWFHKESGGFGKAAATADVKSIIGLYKFLDENRNSLITGE